MRGKILTIALFFGLCGTAQAQLFDNNRIRPYNPDPMDQYRTDGNSPRIYDSQGQYRGNLNSNQYDPNSIANPYGRYGSPYSNDSLNNPYSRR